MAARSRLAPTRPASCASHAAHQQWTHAQLDPALRATVASWPYVQHLADEQVHTTLLHYALADDGQTWRPIIAQPVAADLDRLFAAEAAQLIRYGHHHPQSDLAGRARYVNPGSLGCAPRAVARYAVLDYHTGSVGVEHRAVPYDDTTVFAAFEARAVPERRFIYRAFFGGQFDVEGRCQGAVPDLVRRRPVEFSYWCS